MATGALAKSSFTDWIIAALTLAIVYLAWSGSRQTDKLIAASQRNAEAATKFSESAKSINTEIEQAVTHFQTMATANQDSATAARLSAVTARDALKAQRAFVFPGDPEAIGISNGSEVEAVLFRFTWQNSGTTPTVNMTMHVNCGDLPNGLPKDFNFPDVWSEGPQFDIPTIIGPHGSIGISPPPVTADRIRAFQAHQTQIYFWGRAKYHDIFDNKLEHVTKFCYQLMGFYGDPLVPNAAGRLQLQNCGTHNCFDSECR